MCLVDACRPDWYQSLCDSDTSRDTSLKRLGQSVDRTLTYLDQCLDVQSTLSVIKSVTEFLCVKTSSGKVVEQSISYEITEKI